MVAVGRAGSRIPGTYPRLDAGQFSGIHGADPRGLAQNFILTGSCPLVPRSGWRRMSREAVGPPGSLSNDTGFDQSPYTFRRTKVFAAVAGMV